MAVASGPMGIHNALILGLDPGRDKVGFAASDLSGELWFSGILPAREFEGWLVRLRSSECCHAGLFVPQVLEDGNSGEGVPVAVALGNGTCCGELAAALRKADLRCRILCVDERGTTLEARQLYWRLHRPGWWQRLLPSSMRVPPRPLDDLAAWAIALRGLGVYKNLKLRTGQDGGED